MNNRTNYKTIETYNECRSFRDDKQADNKIKEKYSDYYKACMTNSDCNPGHSCNSNQICLSPAISVKGWSSTTR